MLQSRLIPLIVVGTLSFSPVSLMAGVVKLSFTYGVGYGSTSNHEGLAAAGSLSLQFKGPYLSVRSAEVAKGIPVGIGSSERIGEVALLIGWVEPIGKGRTVAVQIGGGEVTSVRQEGYGEITESAWGLDFQAEVFYKRIGVTFLANTNRVESFAMALLSFRIGGFRSR